MCSLLFLCLSFFFSGKRASLYFIFLFSLEFLTKPWKYEYSLLKMNENLFLKNNSFVTFIHFAEILSLLELENGWVRENDLPKTCCYLIPNSHKRALCR